MKIASIVCIICFSNDTALSRVDSLGARPKGPYVRAAVSGDLIKQSEVHTAPCGFIAVHFRTGWRWFATLPALLITSIYQHSIEKCRWWSGKFCWCTTTSTAPDCTQWRENIFRLPVASSFRRLDHLCHCINLWHLPDILNYYQSVHSCDRLASSSQNVTIADPSCVWH